VILINSLPLLLLIRKYDFPSYPILISARASFVVVRSPIICKYPSSKSIIIPAGVPEEAVYEALSIVPLSPLKLIRP
jgi:hypothetical protein